MKHPFPAGRPGQRTYARGAGQSPIKHHSASDLLLPTGDGQHGYKPGLPPEPDCSQLMGFP